jgi:hypothetical protein
VGPDGNLWYSTYYNNTLVRLSPAGVVLGQYTLPAPNDDPSAIVTGPDGSLWFTEQGVGRIGRLSILSQAQGAGGSAPAALGVSMRSSVVVPTSPTPDGPMVVNPVAPSTSEGMGLTVNLVTRGQTSSDASDGGPSADSTALTSSPVGLAPIGWSALQDLAIDDLFGGVPRRRPFSFRGLN